MFTPSLRSIGTVVSVLGASACGGGDLPGNYYAVDVAGAANSCTGDGSSYTESYEYRLEVDVQDVKLSIGEDLWAAGSADGCLVTYESIVWEEPIDDYVVKWQIQGQARVNTGGGSGCVEGGDWEGTESFVILVSDHPDIAAGCTYDLDVTGTWIQEL
jgi:hypothetical protein